MPVVQAVFDCVVHHKYVYACIYMYVRMHVSLWEQLCSADGQADDNNDCVSMFLWKFCWFSQW